MVENTFLSDYGIVIDRPISDLLQDASSSDIDIPAVVSRKFARHRIVFDAQMESEQATHERPAIIHRGDLSHAARSGCQRPTQEACTRRGGLIAIIYYTCWVQ